MASKSTVYCPKCTNTLALTEADLRAAQGYVRCGRCRNVFNARTAMIAGEERRASGGPVRQTRALPRPEEPGNAGEAPKTTTRPLTAGIPWSTKPRGSAASIGSVIADRYELLSRLGGGGMGEVYKALDRLTQSQQDPDPYVAIKILKPELQQNRIAVMALQREAARARRLTHSNILRIHQFEKDTSSGLYFIVMELLEGRALHSIMEAHPSGQRWAQISGFLRQICAGLQYAHEHGKLIHSDITPGNLFITTRGEAKILDFGIAAPLPEVSVGKHVTIVNPRRLRVLTRAYASLEMFQGRRAHATDDVYSLACVTYEWLSGTAPYVRADPPHPPVSAPEAAQLCLEPAPVPGLTRSQNHALRKALALRRSERTQTVSEFWQSMAVTRPAWQDWPIWQDWSLMQGWPILRVAQVWPARQLAAAAALSLLLASLVLLVVLWLLS